MRKDGYVSIWVGTAAAPDVLEEILRAGYSDDGDWLAPAFAEAFGVGVFDDAMREAEVLSSPTHSIREALDGFSYGTTIIGHLETRGALSLTTPVSAVILLYDVQHHGAPRTAIVRNQQWSFVACVPYR